MTWKNIVKGQEPKDDPRIQRFVSRQKPEYEVGEENKIARRKEANKLRMELAEKMLDEDGYINMLEFFDSKPPSLYGTPLSHDWIERDMFHEKAPLQTTEFRLDWPSKENFYSEKVSPFYFKDSDWYYSASSKWEDTPKKEKLEMFRESLPSEEGGIMEPVSSKAKPTYAEEEMFGRDIFDNEEDPRKRPIELDSGTFPMGLNREPFGSNIDVKNKSWFEGVRKGLSCPKCGAKGTFRMKPGSYSVRGRKRVRQSMNVLNVASSK